MNFVELNHGLDQSFQIYIRGIGKLTKEDKNPSQNKNLRYFLVRAIVAILASINLISRNRAYL